MAFSKSLVLCSPLSGQLVSGDGQPVAGAKVSRSWDWAWGKEKGGDEAVTDGNGNFSFPEIGGKSFTAGFLPHTPSIVQTFTVQNDDGTLEILAMDKGNYDLHGELQGKPLNVRCFIDRKPSASGFFWGTCEDAS